MSASRDRPWASNPSEQSAHGGTDQKNLRVKACGRPPAYSDPVTSSEVAITRPLHRPLPRCGTETDWVRSAARIGRDAEGRPDIGASLERSRDLLDAGVTDLDVPLTFFPDRETFFDKAAEAIAALDWVAR